MNRINVNIWDDFHDVGYAPDGEIQGTYAYVEDSNMADDDCKSVLELLKQNIESLMKPEWNLKLEISYYDCALKYPQLVGTEYEFNLYKRWQLEMKNLSYEALYFLVENLKDKKMQYMERAIFVYSES